MNDNHSTEYPVSGRQKHIKHSKLVGINAADFWTNNS